MYFADYSLYSYETSFLDPTDPSVVYNIGWLENGHEFNIAEPDEVFLNQLFELSRTSINKMRGEHHCDLCHIDDVQFHVRNYDGVVCRYPYRTVEVWRGQASTLGNGEIWVRGEGDCVFAAPNLIFHYVRKHQYNPPQEFIEAVNRHYLNNHCSPLYRHLDTPPYKF